MKLSVIVPLYNSEKTLSRCLGSICNSDYKDLEVIAVDDYSQDASKSIAEKFSCKLLTADKKGQSYTRNKGIEAATGDIIVFVDSDVVIKKDSLRKISKAFQDNGDIIAVTGILSKDHPRKNFFSQYKNLYMNYVFNKMPEYINFLYGSIFAVKRQHIEDFDTKTLNYALDTELGVRIQRKGGNILLDKKLEVTHLKKYTFLSFIKNDFQIPFSWGQIFMRHKGFKYLFKEKKFAHARLPQIFSVLLSPVAAAALLFSLKAPGAIGLFLLLAFLVLILNIDFLNFLKKEKGTLFFLASAPVLFMDSLVMFTGIIAGFVKYIATVDRA